MSISTSSSRTLPGFEMFGNLRPPSGIEAQGVGAPSGAGGKDPRLAMLDRKMEQAGLSTGGGLTEQWSLPGWITDVVDVGKKVFDFGKGLGLFSEGPEAQIEAQFLETFLRSQVEALIQKLHEYVNRYGNLMECVPLVTKCVEQFGSGQYGSALATGYQAYSCISSKI